MPVIHKQRLGGVFPLCLQRMGSHGREIVGDFWGTLPQTAARRAALGSEDLAGIMARWRAFDFCPEQNNGPLCWWHSRA